MRHNIRFCLTQSRKVGTFGAIGGGLAWPAPPFNQRTSVFSFCRVFILHNRGTL